MRNTGTTAITIQAVTQNGPASFSLEGLSLPLILVAGQSAEFAVNFTPQAAGHVDGNLAYTSDASSSTLYLYVHGTGVTPGVLTPNPPSLTFGNLLVGNRQTLTETLTNSGGSNIAIISASVTGAGFSLSGLYLPSTLVPGKSVSFGAIFSPESSGAISGSLRITSDASNPALDLPLAGTGVASGLLAASPASLSFGSAQVGTTQTLSGTIANSGGSSVTITQATVTGAGFNVTGLTLPLTLTAGQSTAFSATFTPQAASSSSGTLAVSSDASNPTLTLPLSGTGATAGSLAANPSTLSFGSVQVCSSNTLSEVVTNSGGSSITITQANLTGSAFTLSGLNLPLTLTAGQSVTFSALFTPTSASSVSESLAVVSNASNSTLTISLSGTGTAAGQLTVSPATLGFGSVVVGASKSLTGTLSASGSSVTVSSASVSTSEFALSGLPFPIALAAGQSISFTVIFTPQSSGAASASASFVSNASTSPIAEALTGSGTPPPQHSVSLSWTPSTSSVVGYNIYRGTISGGPYTKINSALNVSTTYTDNSVQAGQTYFYVTTAVDAAGKESAQSNEVPAAIPMP